MDPMIPILALIVVLVYAQHGRELMGCKSPMGGQYMEP